MRRVAAGTASAGAPAWAAGAPGARHRLQRWWRDYRWSALLALWVLVAILGHVGFTQQARRQGEEWAFLGTLYMTLQLFTLESGSDLGQGPIHPALEVARWMAPLVAAFTAAEALAALFYDRWQLWKARSLRDHVVLCGLGEKGLLLARSFREMGLPVFVIEQDDLNDFCEPARAHGAIIYFGDAREPETLARARVETARYLIAVCGDDGVNAEIATVARTLAAGQRGAGAAPLTCVTHVVNPHLWHLLRRWELSGTEAAFRLQFFNVYDIGARALLGLHSPFPEERVESAAPLPPHLLVVGGGQMGQSVILHALREWRDLEYAGDRRLVVTLIDRDVAAARAWLRLRHPDFDSFCDLREREMDTASPEFHLAAFLDAADAPVGAIYVCLPDDTESLSAALALHRRTHLVGVPVVACLTHGSGLATLLTGSEMDPLSGALADTLIGFGLLEHSCTPELVLGGVTEVLARAMHEHYLHHHGDERDHGPGAAGATGRHSGDLSWDALGEEWRESNRRQADHIRHKLQVVGFGIAPVLEWGETAFPFTEAEVETMARLEHERWREERQAQGWAYGPARDEQRRTNPYLVPWNELPEATRVFNRDLVRRIPDLLLRTGFQVYRLTPPAAAPAPEPAPTLRGT